PAWDAPPSDPAPRSIAVNVSPSLRRPLARGKSHSPPPKPRPDRELTRSVFLPQYQFRPPCRNGCTVQKNPFLVGLSLPHFGGPWSPPPRANDAMLGSGPLRSRDSHASVIRKSYHRLLMSGVPLGLTGPQRAFRGDLVRKYIVEFIGTFFLVFTVGM